MSASKLSTSLQFGFQAVPKKLVVVGGLVSLSALLWLAYKSLPSSCHSDGPLAEVKRPQSAAELIEQAVKISIDAIADIDAKAKDERRLYYGADKVKYEEIIVHYGKQTLAVVGQAIERIVVKTGLPWEKLIQFLAPYHNTDTPIRNKHQRSVDWDILDYARSRLADDNNSLKYRPEKAKAIYQFLIREYAEYKALNKKYTRMIKDALIADRLFYEYGIEWEDLEKRPDLKTSEEIKALRWVLNRQRDQEPLHADSSGVIGEVLKKHGVV